MAEDAPQRHPLRTLGKAAVIVVAVIGGLLIGYGITVAIVGFLHVTGS